MLSNGEASLSDSFSQFNVLEFIRSQKVRSIDHVSDEPVFKMALQLRQHFLFQVEN